MAKTSNLLQSLIERATGERFDAVAIQEIGDELAKSGAAFTINGGDASIVNENFAAFGSKSSVVNFALFRKDLILALANLENKNHFFFMINANSGDVDVGFDVSKIFQGVPEGAEHNFRYRTHVDLIPEFLGGIFVNKTWVDEVTTDQYSSIKDEDTLSAVAIEILEAKVLRMQLAGEL